MMTTIRSRSVCRGLMTLVVAAMILVGARTAWAGQIAVSVGAPGSAAVGSTVQVQATVTSDGVPVAGAMVSLSYRTSLGGVSGPVELDRAVTDANGFAALFYEQRAANNGEMRVDYVGPEEGVTAGATFTIAVQPGGVQQYRSVSGVAIPWLNATVVIGLITLLWSVIAFSAFQLVLIGRRGLAASGDEMPRGTRLSGDQGSAWIGTALATAALITATGMVIVFSRSPLTHGNLGDAEGYTRTPVDYLDSEYDFAGYGMEIPGVTDTADPVNNGAALWVRIGCVACHGPRATGGVIGPNVSDVESLTDFSEDVRQGPGVMPAFEASILTDEQLAQIHAWLEAGAPPYHHP